MYLIKFLIHVNVYTKYIISLINIYNTIKMNIYKKNELIMYIHKTNYTHKCIRVAITLKKIRYGLIKMKLIPIRSSYKSFQDMHMNVRDFV